MKVMRRAIAVILATVVLMGISGCADGGASSPSTQELETPLHLVQLLNADADVVRELMVKTFGSENLKSGYGQDYRKTPSDIENELVLEGRGSLQVAGELRDASVGVSVVGQSDFDTPDEFMSAYDDTANKRRASASWITDEQDVNKILDEALATCGLGKAESIKELSLGQVANGSCTVNGEQVSWEVSIISFGDEDATKLPEYDVVVLVNYN